MSRVVIVGGGIAGLATAYELSSRAVPFVLLEGSRRAGGVVLSEQVDDFTIDAGPDSLLVQKPAGIELCEELGLGQRLVPTKPPRLSFILRGGTLYPLPASSVLGIPTRVGPFVRARLFSLAGKLRMGAEVFVPRSTESGGDESIGGFISRRFGSEAATYLAEPLLAGIHAGDVDRLSARALFPRFVEAERIHGSLIRAFRAERRKRDAELRSPRPDLKTRGPGVPGSSEHARATDGPFRSLPGGLSEMIRALVAALPPQSVRLDTAVHEIARHPSGALQVHTSSEDRLTAPAVVLATPAYATARLVRDLDGRLARLCDEIRYTSTATIALAFPREGVAHPLNGSGFVVPRVEGSGILAASWLSSKWPDRAPASRVLMRAFAGGARDPAALERSDAELVTLAMHTLTPLLGITSTPLLSRVYRWERANAQHEVGHLARMAAIERTLDAHPGLFVTGSGFRGVGIPDCVADGRATARQVSDWLNGGPEARRTKAAAPGARGLT